MKRLSGSYDRLIVLMIVLAVMAVGFAVVQFN
jgi:hypothetical protein